MVLKQFHATSEHSPALSLVVSSARLPLPTSPSRSAPAAPLWPYRAFAAAHTSLSPNRRRPLPPSGEFKIHMNKFRESLRREGRKYLFKKRHWHNQFRPKAACSLGRTCLIKKLQEKWSKTLRASVASFVDIKLMFVQFFSVPFAPNHYGHGSLGRPVSRNQDTA